MQFGPVRKHLTTWVWFNDRICSLSCAWLVVVSLALTLGLSTLGRIAFEFFDDLTFLLGDNDLLTALVLLEMLIVTSAGLWLLAICLGALGRRLLLRIRGL